MLDYIDFGEKEWINWLLSHREEKYHAAQILQWLYCKGITQWEEMSNLSKGLREKLAEDFKSPSLDIASIVESGDSTTVKFSFQSFDRHQIEAVLSFSGRKRIASLSSQIGSLSGTQPFMLHKPAFVRNLRPTEIIEQAISINRWLADKGEKITHISFSATGEPLKNAPSVLKVLTRLIDSGCMNISQSNIELSTIGIPEGIAKLSEEGLAIGLTIELHAPSQQLRKQLIPYAKKYPLEDILSAAERYAVKVNRPVTYDYLLVAGINDHPDHAWELGRLLKGKHCQVSLIPFSSPDSKWKGPEKKAIKQFRSVLFGCQIANVMCPTHSA